MLNINEQKLPGLRWGVFGLYLVIVVMGVVNHESWSDEAQAWLIARDNGIAGIFRLLASEGHPPLWYLLLYPITHSGLPYESIKLLSALICIASVYIILFKTNIDLALKVLLPFSYVFLFEYAHFGRSYCLIVFFMASIISLYEARFERPLLFALCIIGLFNTHILVFPLALGLAVLYITDALQYRKTNAYVWGAFVAMCVGGLYLIPYFTTDKMVSYLANNITDHKGNIIAAINGAIAPENSPALGMLLLTAIVILLAQRTKILALAIFALSGVLYILGYRYSGALRHFAVVFVVLLTCYGIAGHYVKDTINILKKTGMQLVQYGTWVLCAVILLQLPYTSKRYMQDIHSLYSDTRNVAEYIQENIAKDAIIIGHQSITTLGVLPYLPGKKLYYADCQRYGTFNIYDTCYRQARWKYSVEYALNIAHANFGDSMRRVVFLFNHPVMPQFEKYVDLQYVTTDSTVLWDESFYVYKFKEQLK